MRFEEILFKTHGSQIWQFSRNHPFLFGLLKSILGDSLVLGDSLR